MKTYFLLSLGTLLMVACQPRQDTEPKAKPAPVAAAPAPQEAEPAAKVTPAIKAGPTTSMVVISATNQGYSLIQPWSKEDPSYSQGFALYLGDGNFLTASNIVYSGSFIEISYADESRTVPVIVSAFDPESNLSILRLKHKKDADFLDQLAPVKLGTAPKLNDKVDIWQFNQDGLPLITPGTILATETYEPFVANTSFVHYNVKSSITPLRGGAGNPVMVGDTLVGMSANCNTSSQKVLAATHTMLKHFLKRACSKQPYVGFPEDSTRVVALTDPVFRNYLGLPTDGGGIYCAEVPEHSSFYKAGIRKGDVIESIDGHKTDNNGRIHDDRLGPISSNYILKDSHDVGDVINIRIRRQVKDGKSRSLTLPVTLDREVINHSIINRNPFPEAPAYRIYGGLVFTPLSGALMNAINKLSKNRPPMTLLDVINHSDDLQKQGIDEIVVFMFTLPTQTTLGYAEMTPSIVRKVNGVTVKSLKHLNTLLDTPAPNGMLTIEVSQQPYTLYMSQSDAAQADNLVRMRAIPVLRRD